MKAVIGGGNSYITKGSGILITLSNLLVYVTNFSQSTIP